MLKVTSTSGLWEPFCRRIEAFLRVDTVDMMIDGYPVRGYRSPDAPSLWIRDHSDMLRVGRYFEADVRSAPTCFAAAQAVNGRIYDYVTTFPEKKPCERENWEKWVRVPVEADVEYRFVKAVYLAWQAAGDDSWLSALLPSCERALVYSLTHPWRWDDVNGLIKRPYTIDTWDFDYTAGRHEWLNFQITTDTFWGLSHADNSGFYEAAVLMTAMCRTLGNEEDARRWHRTAEGIRDRANQVLFNGRFYTHFFKLGPVEIEGVDEAEQLSLSNPMAVNRGLATPEIARAILEEYRRRRQSTGAFAEWFSIDPPFPDGIFGDEKLVGGAYVNGGIMPLVGGELALAAFENGFEQYGLETLEQYRALIEERGETYLWYFPDGSPSSVEKSTSPDAMPTDGWGSSAMLLAFLQGLCGITDRFHSFSRVYLAPRWAVTNETEAEVTLGYAASGAAFGYRYRHEAAHRRIVLEIEAEESEVALHLLLPEGARTARPVQPGADTPSEVTAVGERCYLDATFAVRGATALEVTYGFD